MLVFKVLLTSVNCIKHFRKLYKVDISKSPFAFVGLFNFRLWMICKGSGSRVEIFSITPCDHVGILRELLQK